MRFEAELVCTQRNSISQYSDLIACEEGSAYSLSMAILVAYAPPTTMNASVGRSDSALFAAAFARILPSCDGSIKFGVGTTMSR